MVSWGDSDDVIKVAGFAFPKGNFVGIWKHLNVNDVWLWEVTLLEKEKNTRFASGIVSNYLEALESAKIVISFWLSSEFTLADEREMNLMCVDLVDMDFIEHKLGFIK